MLYGLCPPVLPSNQLVGKARATPVSSRAAHSIDQVQFCRRCLFEGGRADKLSYCCHRHRMCRPGMQWHCCQTCHSLRRSLQQQQGSNKRWKPSRSCTRAVGHCPVHQTTWRALATCAGCTLSRHRSCSGAAAGGCPPAAYQCMQLHQGRPQTVCTSPRDKPRR
jgi:hypothetical protein